MAKSTDDGKTWSKPINITEQVKDPSWYFLLQGPGRGITMSDGTLVFPTQFIDSTRVPNAGIMYSKDRGKTWKMHNMARTNTTEAQVVETEPGVLMLNMRDNRGGCLLYTSRPRLTTGLNGCHSGNTCANYVTDTHRRSFQQFFVRYGRNCCSDASTFLSTVSHNNYFIQ